MECVLAHLKWSIALVYLDNIIAYAPMFSEHQRRLELVLSTLDDGGLRIKCLKYLFGYSQVTYLGHVSARGIGPYPSKLRAFASIPPPTSAVSPLASLLVLHPSMNFRRKINTRIMAPTKNQPSRTL